jgi:sugar/nucleoside kinase (ribokinase family)
MFRKNDVLCIGSATVDHFITTEQPLASLRLGDKVLIKSKEMHSGGGATNSAAALSKLGLKVKMLTKLGHDHDAEFIKKEMAPYRVRNICLHKSRKNTDSSIIISSIKEKDRIIYVQKGASLDLRINDFKKSNLNTKWIYLASLMDKSFKTAKGIVEYAQKNKIKILFNPSLYLAKKGKNYLKKVLNNTEILVLNKEEAQALLNTKSDFKTLLLELQKLGPKTIVITNGTKRFYALDNEHIYSLVPPKVERVNTAGAGDAFTSGLLAGIIKGWSIEDSLCLGQANSSSLIQSVGTKSGLLTEAAAKRLIKKLKIKVLQHPT